MDRAAAFEAVCFRFESEVGRHKKIGIGKGDKMSEKIDNKDKLEVKPYEEVLKEYENMKEKLDSNLKDEIEKEKLIINNTIDLASNTITSVDLKNGTSNNSATYQDEGILKGGQISNFKLIDYELNNKQKSEINNIQRYLFMLFIDAVDRQMEKMTTYSKEEILEIKKSLLSQIKYIGLGYEEGTGECYYLHEGPDLKNSNKNRIYKYTFPYSIKLKDEDGQVVVESTTFNKDLIKADSYEELDEGVQNIINLTSINTLEDAFSSDKDMAYKINYVESPSLNKIMYFLVIPFIIIIACFIFAITR